MKLLSTIGTLCIVIFGATSVVADNIPAQHGTVALTFDDGPNPDYTPKILAVLKENHIHATFFMVAANAKRWPYLVKMILADGNKIGNHSYTHPMLTKLSAAGLHHEVIDSENVIANIAGFRPACLRYPFGASNAHVRAYIHAAGITPVPMGWNTFDYDEPGVQKIVSQAMKGVHSGAVILMHDGFPGVNRSQTLAALPILIADVRKKGLGFSAICG